MLVVLLASKAQIHVRPALQNAVKSILLRHRCNNTAADIGAVCLIGGGFNPIYEEERAILKMLIDENNCIRMSCGIIVDNRLIVEKGPLNNCQTYITRIDRHKRIAELGIELWKEPRSIKAGLEVRAKC